MDIKDLDRQIKGKALGNLYFFYGEEQFLMENKVKAMKNALLDGDLAELNFVAIDEK